MPHFEHHRATQLATATWWRDEVLRFDGGDHIAPLSHPNTTRHSAVVRRRCWAQYCFARAAVVTAPATPLSHVAPCGSERGAVIERQAQPAPTRTALQLTARVRVFPSTDWHVPVEHWGVGRLADLLDTLLAQGRA
jgi:hypothetical protein